MTDHSLTQLCYPDQSSNTSWLDLAFITQNMNSIAQTSAITSKLDCNWFCTYRKKMLLLCISLQNPLPTSRRDSNSSGIKPTKLVRFMFNSYNADNLAVCCFSICKFLKLTTAIAFCIPLNRDTWVLPFLLHFRSACLTKVLILLHMVENRLINIMKAATVH